MPEFIRTAEVIGNVAEKIFHAGQFVVERFQGGGHGWDNLPKKPVSANITYYPEGEHHDPPTV